MDTRSARPQAARAATATIEQAKALEGHLVDLRVSARRLVDKSAFRCRLIAVEQQQGRDVVYVEPVGREPVGLAIPLDKIKSIEPSQSAAS